MSGTSSISTATSGLSRPGQPETRQRARQKRRFSAKPSLIPIGTPSNAMAASMPSFGRSTNRSRKGHPPTAQDRSTISASGGHADAVVLVDHSQKGVGPLKWSTFPATTTLLSERARASPLWFGTFPKRRIRRGITRISRVPCEKAMRGFASRVPASHGASARRAGGGGSGGSDPPFLTAGAAPASVHRRTRWRTVNTPLGGVAPSTVIPAGRPPGALSRSRWMSVSTCSFVT